jgi:hypothetical protein
MLLTIDKIKELRQGDKKKWGKALANYLKPHFDNNERLDAIQELLLNQYGIEMSLTNLQKLKSNHYNKPKKIATFAEPKIIPVVSNNVSYTEKKEKKQQFVKNQDKPTTQDDWAKKAYEQIYGQEKGNEFDLEGL